MVFGIFFFSKLRADDLSQRIRSIPDFFKPDFSDSAWRTVTLPHDWSIEQHIDPSAPTGGPGG